MGKKEILSAASEELEILTRYPESFSFGTVFELLVKYDPSIPRNEDPSLARLEEVIISLMEQARLYTPDIILMSYQNENKETITIDKIGEIKLGFWEIEKIEKAISQQRYFLPNLKKFLIPENFAEITKRQGLVFRQPFKIKIADNCPIFYVLPQGATLPEGITASEVLHSSFSHQDIEKIVRDLPNL